ncbi:putative ornithine carbamoyltransferase precursor [Exidia glandulosa HHB12029]|uniref:ornithine carbamoyltransferase n=1 Tax=Exidia glandulosa HHB12029 TaxID=1314781 RepID=A0A165F4D4_EXIGL|nr:putative ornithine carbamoyltransferase precursor [Exidia glandulosa HHB12029]
MAALATAAASASKRGPTLRNLLTLADVSVEGLQRLLTSAAEINRITPTKIRALVPPAPMDNWLNKKAIALLFSKRSTRTRVAAEVAIRRMGGSPVFLAPDDIQLGVNESLADTAQVLNQLVQAIFARVGPHSDIEALAANTTIPVINALSDLWHPTQVLADLLTIADSAARFNANASSTEQQISLGKKHLPPLTVAWVGDSTNVLHDMLVSFPRLGLKMRVATPKGYGTPEPVMARIRELGCADSIVFTHDPQEAVHGANVVATDTWISMGQEDEKAARLEAFKGYQVTEALCQAGGAEPNWQFLHCLPRKAEEVDDAVFYGPRSLVFREAHNRLPTIQAVFAAIFRPAFGVAQPHYEIKQKE